MMEAGMLSCSTWLQRQAISAICGMLASYSSSILQLADQDRLAFASRSHWKVCERIPNYYSDSTTLGDQLHPERRE